MTNIVFEDHTHVRFRPLSWSQPTYELRCGMFNTRERLELAAPGRQGLLLSREILRPLHMAPGWERTPTPPGGRSLWLNGRLAPDAALIAALHAARDRDWAIFDEAGLLAASLGEQQGAEWLASWEAWAADAWTDATWSPESLLAAFPSPDLPGELTACGLGWIWDVVPATAAAISGDLGLVADGTPYGRHPFGLVPRQDCRWQQLDSLRRMSPETVSGAVVVTGDGGLYLGNGGVELADGVQIDTTGGPVVLDSGVRVMPHTYLAGPLYVGRESIIKPGARIFGESSFGLGNRLAGEIGESTFGDFANKQHDGFIGHAVLGSWINLGAGTTCSDLKNNYSQVRVDLGTGAQNTGQQFVGLLLGDHAKTAIGSLFNTGTCVGFASNIFGGGMPPKHVANFSWGGAPGAPVYDSDRAQETAAIVMSRRNCQWRDAHARVFDFLHQHRGG